MNTLLDYRREAYPDDESVALPVQLLSAATVMHAIARYPLDAEGIPVHRCPRDRALSGLDRKLIPWKILYGICKRSSLRSLLSGEVSQEPFREMNDFVGVVVVAGDTDPDMYAQEHDLPARFVYRKPAVTSRDSSDVLEPSALGIELPAPLPVGHFNSDSRYVFLPWSDGLVCSCPYKHRYPWRVACKHELLATLVAGSEDSIFLPLDGGVDIPTRGRRFVSPTVYCQHEPSTHTSR